MDDAWIANKCNELVLAAIGPRAQKSMLKGDPALLQAYELLREEELEVDRLPLAEMTAVRSTIKEYHSTQISNTASLPEHLQAVADSMIEAIDDCTKQMFRMKWVRNGGQMPPISSHEWNRIYKEVAKLASHHFGRLFTSGQVRESMRRETKRARTHYAFVMQLIEDRKIAASLKKLEGPPSSKT